MKTRVRRAALTSLKIIATCMVAGPGIGVLVLYLVFVGVTAWVGIQFQLSSTPMKGAPVMGLLLVTMLALMPVFAVVGVAVAAVQTLFTGLCLSVIHALKVPEKAAMALSFVPLSFIRFFVAFAIGLAVSFFISPGEAPRQFENLGPLSLQFASAVSAGVCFLVALHWSAIGAAVESQGGTKAMASNPSFKADA